ncbi:glycoside hydrolase family 3 N-terminal domain-containing protein [Solicola sp. PLA-1-18]|uniref:glycoside hydrolase family 3 N-terminal domain-containing protein n=1 Tax=Solicola sp. PLA-1-18 TaxID=3380532 RepID=UPI003B7AAB83
MIPPVMARLVAVAAVMALVLTGCVTATGTPDEPQDRPTRGVATTSSRSAPVDADARRTLASMSLSQRVGQLLMTGTAARRTDPRALRAVTRHHVGNVMLTGRSRRGVAATARVSARMQSRATRAATDGVPLLVATDQEGGAVQVLTGRGFSTMPSALRQGRRSSTALRADARHWGRQLRRAGVTMNLGPVLDTVPRGTARTNLPIGAKKRHYGTSTTRVATRGTAFAQGMRQVGVVPVAKHFPGLGRVTANTDTTRRVVDRRTRRHDPYLRPFRTAVDAGVPVVMMSSAVYTRIDPDHAAAFSPTVIGSVLRGDLGFGGVVMSDDLSNARAVGHLAVGERATRFVGAGGDLVLAIDPADAGPMHRALLRRARSDARFRAKVDAAALRVLTLKQQQ